MSKFKCEIKHGDEFSPEGAIEIRYTANGFQWHGFTLKAEDARILAGKIIAFIEGRK